VRKFRKKRENYGKIALEIQKKISLLSLSLSRKPNTKKPHPFLLVIFVGKLVRMG